MSNEDSDKLYARLHSAAETSIRFEGLDAEMSVLSVAVTPADGARISAALANGDEIPVIELWPTIPAEPDGSRVQVRILARRHGRASSGAIDADALRWGPIVVNVGSRVVAVNGEPVSLTPTEFLLLQTLISAPTRVFARGPLMVTLGIGGMDGDERLLDVHCSRLRKKIQQAGGPRVVNVVRGVGYRLTDGSQGL